MCWEMGIYILYIYAPFYPGNDENVGIFCFAKFSDYDTFIIFLCNLRARYGHAGQERSTVLFCVPTPSRLLEIYGGSSTIH